MEIMIRDEPVCLQQFASWKAWLGRYKCIYNSDDIAILTR